jgi:hypothetical protein
MREREIERVCLVLAAEDVGKAFIFSRATPGTPAGYTYTYFTMY